MAQIDPVVAPNFYPEMSRAFSTWLGGSLVPNSGGGFSMPPVPPFDPRSQIAQEGAGVQVAKNDRQAGAWNSWSPSDMGTNFLADYVARGASMNPDIWAMAQNYNQYGVQGGYPGDQMHMQSQFGGGGKVGAPAMVSGMQYGKTSDAASKYVASMADYGVASEAGRPLQNRAFGAPTASLSYLQPFMNRQRSYNSPTFQPRQPVQRITR